jgi:asparagine synthase (glutamine-hydrolysing)
MCGIAGGVFWSGEVTPARAEEAVTRMTLRLTHRGPDGRGVCSTSADTDGGQRPLVVLGHTRLAIIDVSDAGAQPMQLIASEPGRKTSGGRLSVTYNGETYNFLSLKGELEQRGHRFGSRSDTEVLLHGYDAWGLDLLTKLRGMFAFALWDRAKRQLLLARDRFGIKPLYYYRGDGHLLFASEVRALLASGLVPPQLDAIALWQYLGYQSVPAPRTLVAGVRTLEPGTWMTIGADGTTVQREYWNLLARAGEASGDSPDAARRRVRELLGEAVDAHMVSDVPVGAFLSGGIDSSAVVALMHEAGHRAQTFSVGFAENAFDESAHAALVARKFNATHTHVHLGESDLLDRLPDAIAAMDQPTGDGINTYIVSDAVHARGMKVALSGLGGDEIFGGYPSFARLSRAGEWSRMWGRSPAPLRSAAASAVRLLGRSSVRATKAAAVVESDGSLASIFPLTRQVLSLEQRRALFGDRLSDADAADPYDGLLADAFDAVPDAALFARVSFAEARTYMHDVLLRDTDQMSMAHALEIRVPLLDHELAEYVVALPDACKRANGVPKRLLVEALDGLLPDEIVNRPKQGFTLPFEPWMRGALRPFCEERLGQRGLAGRGLLNAAEVDRLWRSFLNGGTDVSWSRIWVLVVLDAWLESNGSGEWGPPR